MGGVGGCLEGRVGGCLEGRAGGGVPAGDQKTIVLHELGKDGGTAPRLNHNNIAAAAAYFSFSEAARSPFRIN